MKYLFVSNYPLVGHTPSNYQIDKLPVDSRIWTTGMVPPERFVVDSYGFDEFIFFLKFKELGQLKAWDLFNHRCHVVVAECTDKSQALYMLNADVLLNVHVYFCDFPDIQLGHLRPFVMGWHAWDMFGRIKDRPVHANRHAEETNVQANDGRHSSVKEQDV